MLAFKFFFKSCFIFKIFFIVYILFFNLPDNSESEVHGYFVEGVFTGTIKYGGVVYAIEVCSFRTQVISSA